MSNETTWYVKEGVLWSGDHARYACKIGDYGQERIEWLRDELNAAASRLAELQEEVVKLRGVEAQAVEWFNKAEEGYRIAQALQEELDVARAETNEQRARADGWRDKFNADTDRIAGLEVENATLTERAARLVDMADDMWCTLFNVAARDDPEKTLGESLEEMRESYPYEAISDMRGALAATSAAVEKES